MPLNRNAPVPAGNCPQENKELGEPKAIKREQRCNRPGLPTLLPLQAYFTIAPLGAWAFLTGKDTLYDSIELKHSYSNYTYNIYI